MHNTFIYVECYIRFKSIAHSFSFEPTATPVIKKESIETAGVLKKSSTSRIISSYTKQRIISSTEVNCDR